MVGSDSDGSMATVHDGDEATGNSKLSETPPQSSPLAIFVCLFLDTAAPSITPLRHAEEVSRYRHRRWH